jgi:chemotaxis protein methyltransferase CheR
MRFRGDPDGAGRPPKSDGPTAGRDTRPADRDARPADRDARPVNGSGRPVPSGTAHLLAALPLAHGDLDERDTAELAELKAQIEGRAAFHCAGYKEKCLRRRIAVRMRARAVHTYADYGRLLQRDPAEYDRLVDALTVNVSKFFRNPEVWQVIGDRVLPELFALDAPTLRAWSAGAAGGEEAYTLSMLARDHAAETGKDANRLRILGTDIDRQALAFAERAEYTDFAMTDIDPAARDRWFRRNGTYRLREEARAGVRFAVHDLMRDPFPADQHFILCRNVIIYFERWVQEDLFRRFHESLVPGGFLVLGKVEALLGASAGLFRAVANRERVFRRA